MLDIRKPIGLLFLIIGVILVIYSFVDPQITNLELVGANSRVIAINLNLPCGLIMLVFALLMLGLSFWDDVRKKRVQ